MKTADSLGIGVRDVELKSAKDVQANAHQLLYNGGIPSKKREEVWNDIGEPYF